MSSHVRKIFYSLVFELSEGYFFIDQILPFFNLHDLENLYLTSKEISKLVIKQTHLNFCLLFNNEFFAYYNENRHRWQNESKLYKSLLQHVNGINIRVNGNNESILDYIINYSNKVNKLVNVKFDTYIYMNDFWKTFSTSGLKNLTHLESLQVDYNNHAPFLQIFEGKNVNKITIVSRYSSYEDIITLTKTKLDLINFKELVISMSDIAPILWSSFDNLAPEYRKKIKILASNFTINGTTAQAMKKYANQIEFESVCINAPLDKDHSEFNLQSKSYEIRETNLMNIKKIDLPKFCNTKPTRLVLNFIEMALTPLTATNFHVLHTNQYLKRLILVNCKMDFSRINTLELSSLETIDMRNCDFLKYGRVCSLEFIERMLLPNVTSVLCSLPNLDRIPIIQSECLSVLSLPNNDIKCIELERLTKHLHLKTLDLSNNRLSNLANVQTIIGKFKMLKLEGNPFLKQARILDNKLELKCEEFRYDLSRSRHVVTRPMFSGTDSEIIKKFKKEIRTSRGVIPPFRSFTDLKAAFMNAKKPDSFQNTNIIFWNNYFANNQTSLSQDGNMTSVGDSLFNGFTQVAIHLNSSLQKEYSIKWIFLGFDGHGVKALDYEKVIGQLGYIVHEWSFVSTHNEFVKELRRKFPLNTQN